MFPSENPEAYFWNYDHEISFSLSSLDGRWRNDSCWYSWSWNGIIMTTFSKIIKARITSLFEFLPSSCIKTENPWYCYCAILQAYRSPDNRNPSWTSFIPFFLTALNLTSLYKRNKNGISFSLKYMAIFITPGYGYAVIAAVFGFCRSSAGVVGYLSALLVSTSHSLNCQLHLLSGW